MKDMVPFYALFSSILSSKVVFKNSNILHDTRECVVVNICICNIYITRNDVRAINGLRCLNVHIIIAIGKI